MASDIVSFRGSDQGNRPDAPPRGAWWPGALIVVLCGGAMAYFQVVTVIDRGYSNAFTAIAFGVLLVLMGLWIAFYSPLSHRAKWWSIAVPTAIIAFLFATLRIEGTTSQLHPRFVWRWSKSADEVLAEQTLSASRKHETLQTTPHDFSGFLGANRDAFVPNVQLATDWESQPPKLMWKQPIGAGWSAFAVVGDSAFTLEQRGEQEMVTCYDVQTGELRWFDAVNARHKNTIGGDGPSSTPEVRDGRVYAMGGTGILRCLNAATGAKLWQRDVLTDVGTDYDTDANFVHWGRAASPLVVDDLVVVPGGGSPREKKFHSLIAYNKHTGEIAWKGGNRQVSYSSPSLANYAGVRQIVIVNESNISAHDPASGTELWQTKWDGSSNTAASASQTVPLGDDRFFVSKGYSMGGGALFEVKRDAEGSWIVEKIWHNRRVLMTKLNNVVIKDGFIYGPSDGLLQCVDLATGRNKQWEGGESVMQVLRVGDVLLVMGEWGAVSLVEFNSEKYNEIARFQAIEGKTWNNPALAGSYLLVRNGQEAACYELPLTGNSDPAGTETKAPQQVLADTLAAIQPMRDDVGMADSTPAFDFLSRKQAPEIPAVCVLFGEEPLLKQESLDRIRAAVLSGDDGDLSFTKFNGQQTEARAVFDELATVSMFGGGRRLVVVEEADNFVTKNRPRLEDYCDKPRAGSVLVLEVSSWPANTKLYKKVAQVGMQIDCNLPKGKWGSEADDGAVMEWMHERAASRHGAKLGNGAGEMLLEIVGPQLGRLDQELAKLALLAGGDAKGKGAAISRELVEQSVGGWRAKTAWAMIDCVLEGQAKEALLQLDRLLLAGEEPIALLAMMGGSLRRMASATRIVEQAEAQRRRINLKDALKEAGVKPFAVSKAETQLRQIGRQRAAQIFRWLLQADIALKSTRSSGDRPRLVLEELIVRLSKQLASKSAVAGA